MVKRAASALGPIELAVNDQSAASSTPTMDDKGRKRNQASPTAPCPSCGSPVAQGRVGGSLRRFCSASCRWAWHRQERRQKLVEEIEAAACSGCRVAVLKVIRKGNGGKGL
jgi:hypothetical protein